MKIFISCPVTGLCNSIDRVKNEFRAFFSELEHLMIKRNLEYFMAITACNWKNDFDNPIGGVHQDFTEIVDCDEIIAFPWIQDMDGTISPGVCVELGWSSSLKKKLHIFVCDEHKYSPMIFGLEGLTQCDYYKFSGNLDADTLKLVSKILDKIK